MNLFRKLKRLIPALFLLAVPAFAQNPTQFSSIGTISATAGSCAPNLNNSAGCVILPLQKNIGSAAISVLGAFTGTLQFEVTVNGNTTSLGANPSTGGAQVTNATAPGNFTVPLQGASSVQVRASALSAGTPVITIQSSTAPVPFTGGGLHGTGAPSNPCNAGNIYTNDSTGQLYACNAGTWSLQSAGGGSTGTTGQCPYFSATNAVTGATGDCLNLIGVAGADLGAKINACVAAITAGVCDGTGLPNAQTLSTAVTVSKPIVVLLAGQAVSQSANMTFSGAGSGLGCPGGAAPPTFTKAGNIDQVTLSGTNAFVNCGTFAGVNGSFTGNGITVSSATGIVQNTTVSAEASAGINNSSGGKVLYNAVNSVGSSGNPITSGSNGTIFGNTLTCSLSDCFKVSGANNVVFSHNVVNLNPAASTSGLCGENFSGDQIGNSSLFNQIIISDSTNTGNIDKGICLTAPASGHLLNMLVDGGVVTGVLSGTVTTYSVSINNAAGLGNNWSVLIRDIRAVHIGPPVSSGAIIQDIDALNQPVTWENLQLGDGTGFTDGTTTGNNNIYEFLNQPLAFANLPAGAGNGSIVLCSNCGAGVSAAVGGTGSPNLLTRVGGTWVGQAVGTFTFVQTAIGNSNASTVTSGAITTIPGDLLVVAVACSASGGAPTFTLSDAKGVVFTSAITEVTNGTIGAQIFYGIATGGSETVTDTSSVNLCNSNHAITVNEYQHIAQISPEDGAGASASGTGTALASGSYACTNGDLVIGIGYNSATGLGLPGAGFTMRGNPTNATGTEDQTCAGSAANIVFTTASGNWVDAGVAFKRAP